MMDALVSRVSEKTGLSEEQSKQAAETVINFLKERLPAPIAGQLDNFVGGEGGEGGGIGDTISGMTGGMFGGGE